MLATFGFYSVYWFYATVREMKDYAHDATAAPGLWTVLCFVPLVQLYALVRYSELFEAVSDEKFPKWVLFLLWIFFSPAVWFLVQTDLNRKSRRLGCEGSA